MKAALLTESEPTFGEGYRMIIDEVEPLPLEVGQVLVKVEASSVCGRQIAEITGAKGKDCYVPHLLGHEGCGVVESTGEGVTTVEAGDKVVMHWRKGEGIESSFPQYKWGGRMVGAGLVTTFSEKAVVSENRITKIPFNVPSAPAALLGCATTTALGLINNEAKLKIGEGIVVVGVGGVGLSVIQAAKLVSAYPIIAVDINDAKLEKAKELGATHTFINSTDHSSDEHTIKETLKIWRASVNVVVETTGIPDLIEMAYQLVSAAGKIVLVGQPHHREGLSINNFSSYYKGLTVKDSEGGLTQPAVDIPRYINLYEKGILKLDSLITDTYTLDDIANAISDMRQGKVIGKCIITMN